MSVDFVTFRGRGCEAWNRQAPLSEGERWLACCCHSFEIGGWMKSPPRTFWSGSLRYHRLTAMLLASFSGTILFFVLAAVVSNQRQRGVLEAAKNIADDALPAIQHLASARTALREESALLDDLSAGIRPEVDGSPEDPLAELRRSVERLNGDWNAYAALPPYRGELELQAQAKDGLRSLQTSVDELLAQLGSSDVKPARKARNARVARNVERLDANLRALLELNAVRAAEQSEWIAAVRRESRFLSFVLHGLAALFAAIAGISMIRMVRRYGRVAELRVSELEHFAGRVAHDIRSPLSAVGMSLELATRDPQLAQKTRSQLERSGRTVQRIGQLVDGLLVFALSGAPSPKGAGADVRDTLVGVVDGMEPRAKEHDIDLELERLDHGAVACSPGVLSSLFANLIGNAIKYMGDASLRKVMIRARDAGAMMRIEVADTGPGVPRELRQHIFDPYVRAATSSSVPGLGLGLATVRRLVEAHGGAVGVEADVGGGSLFWFELPKVRG
jgi:signal transduction histidine kinase